MLALPHDLSRMLTGVLGNDLHYWPLDTLRQIRADWDPFHRAEAWPITRNNMFTLDMDVRQYDPSEISLKLDGDRLEISGKHEKANKDGHYEYCEFRQMCTVPDNVQVDQLKCKVNNYGYLKVEAPLKNQEKAEPKTLEIPIQVVNRDKIQN